MTISQPNRPMTPEELHDDKVILAKHGRLGWVDCVPEVATLALALESVIRWAEDSTRGTAQFRLGAIYTVAKTALETR